MNHGQQRRIALRSLGRRRVGRVTQAVAVGGTALAAVFGVAFAKSSAADPAFTPPASSETGGDIGDDGQFSPEVPPATDLQPPAELPQQYFGGSGSASSGAS